VSGLSGFRPFAYILGQASRGVALAPALVAAERRPCTQSHINRWAKTNRNASKIRPCYLYDGGSYRRCYPPGFALRQGIPIWFPIISDISLPPRYGKTNGWSKPPYSARELSTTQIYAEVDRTVRAPAS